MVAVLGACGAPESPHPQAAPHKGVTVGGEELLVRPLYEEDFEGALDRWRFDGRGRAWAEDGRLQMDASGVESTAVPDPHQDYLLSLTVREGKIRCYIDGRLIRSFDDPNPHRRGKLAFRSYRTRLWWDNLRVYGIVGDAPAGSAKAEGRIPRL